MLFEQDISSIEQEKLPKRYNGNTVVTKAYLDQIELPSESIGYCKNNRGHSIYCISRKNYNELPLANGYCQGCWDSGKGGQMPKNSKNGRGYRRDE